MARHVLLTALFLFCFNLPLFAQEMNYEASYVETLKKQLQQDLKENYSPELEKALGDCGSDIDSCLVLIDQSYMVANYKEKEVCFPYTLCGFYHCMENKFKCDSVGVDYFTKLAYPTCSQYVKNIDKGMFSKKGVEWIFNVMVCLQKGLVDDCEVKGNCRPSDDLKERKKTCNYITEFTLSYHPGCYINSGVGVCKLPLKDKLNIWKTVNPYLTPREKEEAYKVIFHCLKPKFGKRSLQLAEDSVLLPKL